MTQFKVTIPLIFYLAICIKVAYTKVPSSIAADVLEVTQCKKNGLSESEICLSSLWILKCQNKLRLKGNKHISWRMILILLSGDVERLPGPNSLTIDEMGSQFLQNKGMSIFHQNIRGLYQNFIQLQHMLSLHPKINIMTLSETHIVENSHMDNDSLYQIQGYNLLKRNRIKGHGGGVAVYISKNIRWKQRKELEDQISESIWIEIMIKGSKSLLIGCLYNPPESSTYSNKRFTDTKIKSKRKEVLLTGDFNLKTSENKDFKHMMEVQGFKQLVDKPTRSTINSETLIDLIFSSNPSVIPKVEVIATSLSDHDMIGCIRKINSLKFNHRTIKCRSYSNYDKKKLKLDLCKIDWNPLYRITDVNKALNLFVLNVKSLFDIHAPLLEKRVKGNPSEWLNVELKEEMNTRDKVKRKARKTKSEEDWRLYKYWRNKCNNKLKKAKCEYHKNLLEENISKPKKFWKIIKSVFPNKSSISCLSNNDGKAENLNLANKFAESYTYEAKKLKAASIPFYTPWRFVKRITSRTNKIFKFKCVSKNFIENQIKTLNSNKATGLDQLPPQLLKDVSENISGPICHIINLSIRTSKVPDAWKGAKISPIYKSGLKNEPSNYRPISTLPVLSKILERTVHHQLMNYMEENDLLTTNQFGYRQKRSTKLASTLLCDEIRKSMDKGELVGAVYIDLSKAFDTIGHDLLFNKLSSYGILENELQWFIDYMFNCKQAVNINALLSNPNPIFSGVPQGSILGPLLFLIFFNDFSSHLKHSRVIMYADDTVIYVSHKEKFIIEEYLNYDLEVICKYFNQNELIINLKKGKTESMLFGTAKRIRKSEGDLLNIKYKEKLIYQVKYS